MRVRAAAFVVTLGLTLTACGRSEPSDGAAAIPPHESTSAQATVPTSREATVDDGGVELPGSPSIAEIKKRGKLLVGVRDDAPGFVRREGGEYTGFDVRMARMIAEGLGLDPRTQLAFRKLPSSMRVGAVRGGSTDLQLGGFDPRGDRLVAVGPYVIVEGGSRTGEQYIGVPPGDDRFRQRLRGILADSLRSGRWQRAAEETLDGVEVRKPRPPE